MNTRLQVEHPVTELVTGVDLVEQQLRVAAGEPLAFAQADVRLTGHAIEARIYAESPERGFLPSTGTVLAYAEPQGTGIRVDSGIVDGSEVSPHYDPMLAKVIALGSDRAEALARLDAALADTVVLGVDTNIALPPRPARRPRRAGRRLDTGLIDRMPPPTPARPVARAPRRGGRSRSAPTSAQQPGPALGRCGAAGRASASARIAPRTHDVPGRTTPSSRSRSSDDASGVRR